MSKDYLVQYIILRTDLKWSKGSLANQVSHASANCLWKYRDSPNYCTYMEIPNGAQYAVTLKANDEEFFALIASLEENKLDHFVWTEQPENEPTCICVAPYIKCIIQDHFRHLKLYR
ncbi:hypothetical protein PCE1_001502 [Barthelona sp. PCE]